MIGLPADDRHYYPFYAKCVELGIPLSIHTSANWTSVAVNDLGHPRHLDPVARDFPELRIIVSHGGYPWVLEAVLLAWKYEHVYLELAAHRPKYLGEPGTGWEPLLRFGQTTIADKVVYGSGAFLLQRPVADLVAEFRALPITPAVMERWVSGNATRLLDERLQRKTRRRWRLRACRSRRVLPRSTRHDVGQLLRSGEEGRVVRVERKRRRKGRASAHHLLMPIADRSVAQRVDVDLACACEPFGQLDPMERGTYRLFDQAVLRSVGQLWCTGRVERLDGHFRLDRNAPAQGMHSYGVAQHRLLIAGRQFLEILAGDGQVRSEIHEASNAIRVTFGGRGNEKSSERMAEEDDGSTGSLNRFAHRIDPIEEPNPEPRALDATGRPQPVDNVGLIARRLEPGNQALPAPRTVPAAVHQNDRCSDGDHALGTDELLAARQRPFHMGLRFSANARGPSTTSSLVKSFCTSG
jgi:hypothetical protein